MASMYGEFEVGQRFGALTVVDSSGVDEHGEIVVHVRCDCGTRKLLGAIEVRSRTACGDHCRTRAAKKITPARVYTAGAERYRGRPGVTALGQTRRPENRESLAEFCEHEITRFQVVFGDGSRVIADSFEDAKHLHRHPELANTLAA